MTAVLGALLLAACDVKEARERTERWIQEVNEATADEREAVKQLLEEKLAEWDTEMDELGRKLAEQGDQWVEQSSRMIHEWEYRRDELQRKVDALRGAHPDVWERLKHEALEAAEDARRFYKGEQSEADGAVQDAHK